MPSHSHRKDREGENNWARRRCPPIIHYLTTWHSISLLRKLKKIKKIKFVVKY